MAIRRGRGHGDDHVLELLPVQQVRANVRLEIVVSTPHEAGMRREAAEGRLQELRETVSLAGLVEQTLEVRMRTRAELRVLRLRSKIPSQATARQSPTEIPRDTAEEHTLVHIFFLDSSC